MLVDKNGQAVYEELDSKGSPNLIGLDEDCTGKNDTSLSRQYYARGKEAPKPSTTSTSANPTAGSATSAMTSTTPTASPPAAAAPPKGNGKTSAGHGLSLKSTFLVGIILAPLFGLLA